MSWVGWLILLSAFALVLVFVQGIVQFLWSLVEEHILEPRRYRRAREKPTLRAEPVESSAVVGRREAIREPKSQPKRRLDPPVTVADPPREPSRLGRLLRRLKIVVAPRGYDYWVASALSEPDPEIKIEYLTKALHLDPTYLPAWGLKGHALLGMKRYEEAIACFDRSLEVHPSALLWYRKGLCCHHLNRPADALACFKHALETCPRQDRELFEDAARMKQTVERETHGR